MAQQISALSSPKSFRRDVFSFFDHMLPRTSFIDAGFLLARFVRAHNRLPRNPSRPNATFNDLIFDRLIKANWNSLERFCVDKAHVKAFALGICPDLLTTPTIEILPFAKFPELDAVEAAVLARSGQKVVVKPTHGSGSVLFLRNVPSREEVHRFCVTASQSYYRRSRESLYAELERKVILEEDLSAHGLAPIDYKFFCARGKVLFCQVDVDRFTCHRRALVTTAFEPIHVRYMHDLPAHAPAKPKNFDRMVAAAGKFSAYFSFVRVDLYSIGDRIFLGELTLAPEGGAGSLSDERFGMEVMTAIRQANAHSASTERTSAMERFHRSFQSPVNAEQAPD